jgi:NAD+ diphosphatase
MFFAPAVKPPRERHGAAFWFAFSDEKILVQLRDSGAHVPFLEELTATGLNAVRSQYLGHLGEVPCYSAELSRESAPPQGWTFENLRHLYGVLDERFFDVAVRAKQIVLWDRTHQYCGQCGTATKSVEDERAKVCPQCGLQCFPRLSPAVIVAVTRDDKILLARAQRFPEGFYSVLAGYVEPGETLEQCVKREILEEVGIEVQNIRYFGSQSWPFPHSLMIGFTAEYADGRIRPDASEISEAGWFDRESLPWIPGKISIARRLIDWFVESHGAPVTRGSGTPQPKAPIA